MPPSTGHGSSLNGLWYDNMKCHVTDHSSVIIIVIHDIIQIILYIMLKDFTALKHIKAGTIFGHQILLELLPTELEVPNHGPFQIDLRATCQHIRFFLL